MINPAIDYWDEYAFWEDIEYVVPKLTHNIRPKGNQGKNKETKSACTIVWAVNQIIRLFWLDLDEEQTNTLYLSAVDYCTKLWYVVWEWWTTPTACNSVCKRWNEIWYKTFNKEKVFRVRIYWNNYDKIREFLKNWHMLWYTKNIQFWTDQVEWLVYRDKYPKSVWHRLNLKCRDLTKATWWADGSNAEYWSQDNYHWAIGENFFIEKMDKYINKWVYAWFYWILPVSATKTSVEEEKARIQRLKAVNATIWVLSSTWWDLNSEEQLMSSALATELRNTEWSRAKIDSQELKVYQAVVDMLSYSWKYAWEEEQKKYSELASYLREKFNLL
jgi:hypothetical protein